MCMSYMTTLIYLRLLFDYRITLCLFWYLDKIIIFEMSLLNFSRMAGRGGRGRGRGANDPPPPPDYMAVMMQQFQMHQVFMQGVIDQLQNQNQLHDQNHHHGIDLQGFMCLSPLTSPILNSRWKPMNG